MWTSYEALCEMGATGIDPTSVFGVRPNEIDQVQERMHQQTMAAHQSMPLREKSVLTPHHFSPPEAGAAGVGGRPMEFGTPGGEASIGPKAALFQTAQKSTVKREPGCAAILPHHLQFNTPGLTPIPMQHDASFLQHHNQDQYHQQGAAGVTFQQSSMMSGAEPPFHGFGDSINPHTIRRAKHVAARLYYQPSPETPHHAPGHRGIPPSGRAVQFSSLAGIGEASTRRYLRGKTDLESVSSPGVAIGSTISDTPLRRGGRLSDVSTVRRPRALFLSDNKAMRENNHDLNQSNGAALEDDDDEENNFRPLRSRSQQDGEGVGQSMDAENENQPDDERSNMMTEENVTSTANNTIMTGGGHPSSFLPEDEKPVSSIEHHSDIIVDEDEDAILERQAAVQQILELFCLLGAGYWRLCQVRKDCSNSWNWRHDLYLSVSWNWYHVCTSLTVCLFSV